MNTIATRFLFVAMLVACHEPAAPRGDAPSPGTGDAAPSCAGMCANLAAIGCIEGADVNCVQACTLNQVHPIEVQPVACWADAVDKAAARRCGSIACP